jgi:Replication-relaxation
MRIVSQDGPLLRVRGDREGADVRLTARDRRILVRLAAARWLTTTQVANLFFPDVTVEMARRRLRLLGEESYILSLQANQMAEALHTLGQNGKEFLLARGWKRSIRLERVPPKNLEHFRGVNDIRVAVERSAERDGVELAFFFASWELQQQGWAFPVIPDAACLIERSGKSVTVLYEYDRGEESTEYVARTKFRPYAAEGFHGFPFSDVLVVVDTPERLGQLRERAARCKEPEMFSFILLDDLKSSWSVANFLS